MAKQKKKAKTEIWILILKILPEILKLVYLFLGNSEIMGLIQNIFRTPNT